MVKLDNTKEKFEEVLSWLKSYDFVIDIYLFGSRARGEEHENSDWDILVITDRKIVFPDVKKKFNADVDMFSIDKDSFIMREGIVKL